ELLELLAEGLEEPQLVEADLILCTQPMALCALLRGITDLPMLLYQAFPLVGATPLAFRHLLLLQLRETQVANPKRSSLVAYSEYLSQQVQRQTGQRPICLRPHSLYAARAPTGGGYSPDRENPRVLVSRLAGWARDGAAAVLHLSEAFAERMLRPETRIRLVFLGVQRPDAETVAGISRPFGYNELRRFRAAVYFPWDMGMLLFSELYAVGVPLLIPGRAWIAAMIKRMLENTDFGWWQVREEGSAVALPSRKSLPGSTLSWPWLSANSSIAEILQLYELTDFARWPHVTAFASLPELMVSLRTIDFDSTSQQMIRWNEATLPRSLDILARTLASLLGNQTLHAEKDESSCV
ncbi:unnamed protein product, partial [Polarella glacialis]